MFMPTKNKRHVVVIGGGAAGLSAAFYAQQQGAQVTLLEQNEKLGKKIYITGKGRCNLTNQCTLEDFLANVPTNPRFLYSALHHLSPQGLRALLDSLGCPTVVERGGRVFPASQHASDVTRAFERGLDKTTIRLRAQVQEIIIDAGQAAGVTLAGGEQIRATAVIVATGGLCYPLTGATGDGYRLAQQAAHRVLPCSPSLTGLETADAWTGEVQGLALKNVRLTARRAKCLFMDEVGELLFTHYGVSGPLVLTLSALLSGQALEGVDCQIDLKPGMTPEQLDRKLTQELAQAGAKLLPSILPRFVPARLAGILMQLCAIPPAQGCSQLPQAKRACVVEAIKHLPIRICALRPYSEAVVTRGGVDTKQVDPRTMMSKLAGGLYFAGEVLDVDALTGGFNLHIAFATGALAGHSAALAGTPQFEQTEKMD